MEPYKGLRPYEEQDQDNFFGREAEKHILVDKILTNKLTLLFASSGVGKSSLLQAAVIPHLKAPAGEYLDVVYHKNWFADPITDLKQTLIDYFKEEDIDDNSLELKEFLQLYTNFSSEPLVIILDQFEEFFHYQRGKKRFQPFIEQLTQAILDRDTPTTFVISMREDFALELNAFKSELPTLLFQNFYRLEKLTKDKAKQAIVEPVERCGFSYEKGLLETLLDDLSRREQAVRLDAGDKDFLESPDFVEPPNLQMVCMQLWEADKNNPHSLITQATYDSKGKATGLLNTYFLDKINQLSSTEKKLASGAFDYLVSKYGTKRAERLDELSKKLRVNKPTLEKTLDRLKKDYILSKPVRGQIVWYELYHDIFVNPVSAWNGRYKNRQRIKKVAIGTVAVFISGALVFAGYDGWLNYKSYHLRLSLKAGISDTVEVYLGKKGSYDFFRQQTFLYETSYVRANLEADKLFQQKHIEEIEQLNKEFIGEFPLARRLDAYWENGNIHKALCVASNAISIYDKNLSEQMINDLVEIRSIKGFNLLKTILKREYDTNLKQKMIIALQTMQTPLNLQISLSKDDNAGIRVIAANILGKLGDTKATKVLIELLKDENALVRNAAEFALNELSELTKNENIIVSHKEKSNESLQSHLDKNADKSLIKPLIESLKNPDPNIRLSAIDTLGELGATEAVKPLIELLKDSNSSIRNKAVLALAELGKTEAIKPLIKLLQDSDKSVSFSTIFALSQLGATEAIDPLEELLIDLIKETGVAFFFGKAAMGSLLLEELFQKSQSNYRYYAGFFLAMLGATEAIKPLKELLKDSKSFVRMTAGLALAQLGATEAIKPLIKLLKDKNANVRNNAAMALGKFEAIEAIEAIKPLIELLKDSDLSVRKTAMFALIQLNAIEAIKTLTELFRDTNVDNTIEELFSNDTYSDVRSHAALALGKLGEPLAVKPLIKLLKDSDKDIRNNAIKALAQLGTTEAINSLLKLLKTKNPEMLLNAASALSKLGINNKDLSHILAKELKKLKEQSTGKNIKQRQEAAEKLGEIYSKQSVSLLIPLLKSDFLYVKKQAIISLGQIGEHQANLMRPALPQLYLLLDESNIHIRKAVITTLSKIVPQLSNEKDIWLEKIINIAQNKKELFANRIVALKALANLGTDEAAHIIINIVQQDMDGHNPFVLVAIQTLGNIRSKVALDFLHKQLEDLTKSKRKWRKQRDKDIPSELPSKTQDCAVSPTFSGNKKNIWQQSQWETTLGYAIAQINPENSGIKLLYHELAEVRKGAWLAIGRAGNINIVKALVEKRGESQPYQAHFRHAAYRAIDKSLITIEVKGNEQDLKTLKAWFPTIEHPGIKDRVEWTIYQLEYSLEN
jgi:HEAT repeat protein